VPLPCCLPQVLSRVQKPMARALARYLDLSHPLGLRAVVKPAGGNRRTYVPCQKFITDVKMQHPT
jgi:hypothetical protein